MSDKKNNLIYVALNFLKDEFNAWHKSNMNNPDDQIVLKLSPIVDQDNKLQIDELGMTLVNVEEERVGKIQSPYIEKDRNNKAAGYLQTNPPIKLNLDIMISAAFSSTADNYGEALKHISYVIECFQSRNVFRNDAYPQINPIEKLVLTMLNKEFSQLQSIWMMLGAKYIPSVLYKVKLLVVESQQSEDIAAIQQYQLSLKKNTAEISGFER